jgi:hypothetical protein
MKSGMLLQRLLWRLLVVVVLVLLVGFARAGGPKYVTGNAYFTGTTPGQPVTWAAGTVTYYTDQGDLSPLLPGSAADAFVTDAFSRWTGVATIALNAVHGGQLAEDVNGSNVIRNNDGSITMPADILPSATATPVGVVYDYDGSVTDALLGAGAGDSSSCFYNAAFGGPDAFASTGNFAHALVVLNGNCIQVSPDLIEAKYRLVRVLGRVLGLDWSQLNLNVITGVPHPPTSDDKAGFPLMHAIDPNVCVPITLCYTNPDRLKMDDRAAIARLYPVTTANLAQFPGKQTLSSSTARIFGKVSFTDATGAATQGMQAVNVVARWIDPSSGKPSGQYAASAISGFLFCGNAGNSIVGPNDVTGLPFAQFGSMDSTLEGYFDLAGLELPSGSSGQYQISIEQIDPLWSEVLGPYQPNQVTPSGNFSPVTVNVSLGTGVEQDVPMSRSAVRLSYDPGRGTSWTIVPTVPATGNWSGAIDSYGETQYFTMTAQANRTFAVDVISNDETGQPSQQKLRPMVGVWSMSDPPGTAPPAATTMPFNTVTPSLTRLSVQVLSPGPLRIGIADLRGDGRPDFPFAARVLYGDSAAPVRLSVAGGTPLTVQGIGFQPGMTLSVGGVQGTLLGISGSQVLASSPPLPDGVNTITITDPVNGAATTLINALTYGAAATDRMALTQSNPAIPVGGETPNPITVTVTDSDTNLPVSGATIQWTANNNATLTACAGAATCSAITDESGVAQTRVFLGSSGATLVTAQLAPAAYPNKQVQTTLSSTSSAKSISLLPTRIGAIQGTTVDVPLTARVLTSAGAPVSGQPLNFSITAGTATLNPATATTDSNGYAYSTLHIAALSSEVDVAVCAAGGGIPCPALNVLQIPISALQLQPVAGSQQVITVGHAFAPLVLRVLDSATPPNPVYGVPVAFASTLMLPSGNGTGIGNGDGGGDNFAQKVIVGQSQNIASSDFDGLVEIVPPSGDSTRALDVMVAVGPGNGAVWQFDYSVLWPVASSVEMRPQPPPSARRQIAFQDSHALDSFVPKNQGRGEYEERDSSNPGRAGRDLPTDRNLRNHLDREPQRNGAFADDP